MKRDVDTGDDSRTNDLYAKGRRKKQVHRPGFFLAENTFRSSFFKLSVREVRSLVGAPCPQNGK